MTTHAYSPHTQELIQTETIAPWMSATDVDPPQFDAATQSAFFRDGAWVVEDAQTEAPTYKEFTPLEVLDLFTQAEQLAIVTATQSNAAVKLWYDRLIAATFVTYADPRTGDGIQALAGAGLISAERVTEITTALRETA